MYIYIFIQLDKKKSGTDLQMLRSLEEGVFELLKGLNWIELNRELNCEW